MAPLNHLSGWLTQMEEPNSKKCGNNKDLTN